MIPFSYAVIKMLNVCNKLGGIHNADLFLTNWIVRTYFLLNSNQDANIHVM